MKFPYVCFFLLLITDISYGQNPLRFNHLTSDQGLTSNDITCLYKDKTGFLWIGTDAGLNRFDGKNIITYSHIIGDSTSLINNHIKSIFEDNLNRLWVGTNGGLSILDRQSSTFINITKIITAGRTIDISTRVCSFSKLGHKIYMATQYDLLSTPADSIGFEWLTPKLNYPEKSKIWFIPDRTFSSKSGIWFLTSKGPLYTEDGNTFYHKFNNPEHEPIFNRGWLSAACNNADTSIYFTSFDFPGIYIYYPENHQIDSIPFPTNPDTEDISIMSLCKVSHDEIWGSTTSHGIFRFNLNTRTFNLFRPDKTDPGSLSSLECQTIITDSQGTIFVGTNRGLDFINPLQPPFKIFNIQFTGITNMDISGIEDDKGILWIAPLNQGLFSVDPISGKTEHFQFPGSYNNVWTQYFEKNNIVMVTGGGLATFSTISKKLTPLNKETPETVEKLSKQLSLFIHKDNAGAFWIGLYGNGILKYNPQTKAFIHFTSVDSIYHLPGKGSISCASFDRSETFWVGFNSTDFSKINTTENTILNFKVPRIEDFDKEDIITSMVMDSFNNLWIGTKQTGLFKYNIATNSFTNYDTRKNLSSNIVGSMVIDQQNNLWINTSNGLNKFDPISEIFTLYSMADGLPSNQFNHTTNFMTRDGTIYSGNDIYLVSFNPKDIQSNPNLPKVVLHAYIKSGEPLTIPSTEYPLHFTYRDKISFEFTGINFIDPAKTQYAYYLDGYDDHWNYSGSVSSATYAGLPPRDYVLRIKATNRAGFWEVPETIMNIHVTGPFWKTWWFIASFMGLCLLILFALYYYRLMHIQKIHEIRNKISKDLHDDIGSTLSSISISSTVAEKMSKEQFPEIISTISYIGENSRAAMENMSDIVWAINPANESLKKLIERFQIYAYSILSAKNIRLHLDFPESIYSTKLTMQQRKNIYLILREAIQNVAKYSEATTCLVTGSMVNKKINIQVKDDGLGFDEIITSLGGNGMINMKQRADELRATFDVQSEKLKGTSLTLELNYS